MEPICGRNCTARSPTTRQPPRVLKAWREVRTEEKRERFNDAGGNVGKLEEWRETATSQPGPRCVCGRREMDRRYHPKARPATTRETGWLKNVGDKVHASHTHAYDSIITDGHNGSEPGSVSGSGVIVIGCDCNSQLLLQGRRRRSPIQLALRGEESLSGLLSGHVSRMSRDIASAERRGPNAAATFKHFNDRALQDEIRQSQPPLSAWRNRASLTRTSSMRSRARIKSSISGRRMPSRAFVTG